MGKKEMVNNFVDSKITVYTEEEPTIPITKCKYCVMDKEGKLFNSTSNEEVAIRMSEMIGGYIEEWEDIPEDKQILADVPFSELSSPDKVHLKEEYKVDVPQGIYALWGVETIYSRYGYKNWECTEDVVLTDFVQQDNGLVGIWSAEKPFKPLGYAFPHDLNVEEAVKLRFVGITVPAVNIRRTNLNLSDIIDIAEGKFAELVEAKSTNGFYKFFDRSGYIAKEFTEPITNSCAVMSVRVHEFYKKRKAREEKEREDNLNGQPNKTC